MALQLYLGCSGSGKSHRLYEHIIDESLKHPELNYYILVPEQYNLSTQQKLISMHPKKGILNIDVLSFTRLAHRVFEEVGYSHARGVTIDDIGKNLILRHMAGKNEDKLTALKGSLNKLGYISEVKSVISEFMQYGIGDKELEGLIEKSSERGILKAKLADIRLLYNEFLKYINEKYITTEEILQKVRDEVPRSKKLKKTVIVLDGYTGFTPVQRGLIEELLVNCVDVYVTLLLDISSYRSDPAAGKHGVDGQDLFSLSYKTLTYLDRMCKDRGVTRREDVVLDDEVPARFKYAQGGSLIPDDMRRRELIHLEKNLFRAEEKSFRADACNDGSIHIFTGTTPLEEATEAAVRIERLVREEGYRYKDIAVVTGDPGTYMNAAARAFKRYGIPMFADKTAPVLLNPMIEYIRSLLDIVTNDFGYEAVFRYLRTAMSEYSTASEQIDILENYILRYGIKGRKTWAEEFIRKPRDVSVEELAMLNDIRERIVGDIEVFLHDLTGEDVFLPDAEYDVKVVSTALYRFLRSHKLQEKMEAMEAYFTDEGDMVRAMEYGRIYEEVCDLLGKIVNFMPGERMTIKEYADILDAGFDEIRTGVLPGTDDYVQVGDITRTRLRDIKALFFMGVNDGIIPAASGGGGLLSDMDREFLTGVEGEAGEHIELAPTARMKAYDQRLYLYMLTTKPSEYLYISYSGLDNDGKSVNPSYFVKTIMRLYPTIAVEKPDDGVINRVYGPDSAYDKLAGSVQDLLAGLMAPDDRERFLTLLDSCLTDEGSRDRIRDLIKGALRNRPESGNDAISRAVAEALYGSDLTCSITRLETYAGCAYRHFLKYGLSLRERELFSFDMGDMGSVFHDALETYGSLLKEKDLEWTAVEGSLKNKMIDEAIERCIASGDYEAMYGTFRTGYTVNRMRRIMRRTIDTLTDQLRKGSFKPYDFEVDFSSCSDQDALNIKLTEDEKLNLIGRIDRMDTCSRDGNVYVKIIDYKSGSKSFDLAAIYAGLDLQLVVYMNAGTELISKKYKNDTVIPAGIFYYHIDDPLISYDEGIPDELTAGLIDEKIASQLKMTGLVNSDATVYRLIDSDFGSRSTVIPVGLKKDGSFTSSSCVASTDQFEVISDYVNQKIKEMGNGILGGDIKAHPRKSSENANLPCTRCDYQGVCGYRGEGYYEEPPIDDKSEGTSDMDSIIEAMKKSLS